MDELSKLSQLLPEWEAQFSLRYQLLVSAWAKPGIGRRQLARQLHQTERRIRNEIENLTQLKLIQSSAQGINITASGRQVLADLEPIYASHSSFQPEAQQLTQALGIRRVRIANDPEEIGLLAEQEIQRLLPQVSTLGMSGGSSLKRVVDQLRPQKREQLHVVAVRGSLGQKTAEQANTLAEEMAHKLSAQFYPLMTLDQLQPQTREQLRHEPEIQMALSQIEKVDGLLFGIGRADEMIERRNLSPTLRQKLVELKVVGEALGNFFDADGHHIHALESFGLSLEQLQALQYLIAIAYGARKAQAVLSVAHINPNIILITDQACAEEMLTLLGGRNNGKSGN